jgi:hypothetical protein
MTKRHRICLHRRQKEAKYGTKYLLLPPSELRLTAPLRWQIVWQDSLLSIIFDRTSGVSIVAHIHDSKINSELSYVDAMRRLCKIGLDIVQQRNSQLLAETRLLQISNSRDQIRKQQQHLQRHLIDIGECKSVRDQLEYWNHFLHRSYILFELCRPTLQNRRNRPHRDEIVQSLQALCIESLTDTIEAFLGLQNMTNFATHSWAAVQRVLNCAILLGILKEGLHNDRVRTLISKLTEVMSNLVSTTDDNEVTTPLMKSVSALQRINSKPNHSFEHQADLSHLYEDYHVVDFGFPSELSTPSSAVSSSKNSLTGHPSSPFSVLESIMWGSMDSMPTT